MRRLPKRKACKLDNGLDLITPWLVVAVLFYALRQLEVWLHQHIFKVGWLVTKQYQTTTILYYAFFLPGIILNQLVFWLAAGFLNVSADRTIAWPEKQEIGELKLDFIRLSKNVSPLRFAIISTAPLLVGMIAVWHIANNILNVPLFLAEANRGGFLVNISTALSHFTNAPDFWIWVYLAFTISNTMMPNFANLRGWRIVLLIIGGLIAALYVVGAGDQVVMENLRGPVTNALNSLSSVFAIIIGLDIFMVAVLGTIEAIIERVTGDSATFENGKMITMRRSELIARRQQALAVKPQQKAQQRAAAAAVPVGPPSVYKLSFPIPGAPGKEAVTPSPQIVISQEPKPALASSQPDSRSGPAVISGTVTEKLPPPSSQPTSRVPSNPAAPPAKPAAATISSPTPSSSPFKPATPPTSTPKPATPGSLMSPAAEKPATPTGISPTEKPATPFGVRPSPTSSGATSPTEKPATPVGARPNPTPSGITSPAEKPATPVGTTRSTSSTPAVPSPSTEKPATPVGNIRSTSTSPIVSSPSVKPAPKPTSPFAASDDIDEDEEEGEDEITYVNDESQENQDDEESYEDFEDPA